MASETAHCGQKQMRLADDFCRGLIPTVCANRYTATDFAPAGISRLQRRQYWLSTCTFPILDKQALWRSIAADASVKKDSPRDSASPRNGAGTNL
jgi:hypothetical protein